MNEFYFSDSQRQLELDKLLLRKLVKERIFILLLGPSASGKSTIIRELNIQEKDIAYEYVKPITTRPNRLNETDKISVSDSTFDAMKKNGDFIVTNELYNVCYGTPLSGIIEPLDRGSIPILDYPLETVNALQNPRYDTLNFYIYPPSMDVWRKRIENSGRNIEGRMESGIKELGFLALSNYIHPNIDISIINEEGSADKAAQSIIEVIHKIIL